MYEKINELISSISETKVSRLEDNSFSKLNEISLKLREINKNEINNLDRRRILVLCSDSDNTFNNSINTLKQAVNTTKRITEMSAMAKAFGDDVSVVDVGIKHEYNCQDIVEYNVVRGTKNIVKEDSMTIDQCLEAIEIGAKLAKHAKEQRIDVLGVGNIGTNSIIANAILNLSLGLDLSCEESTKAILNELNKAIKERNPNKDDIIDILAKIGGLDVAAMVGVYLGCAKEKLPVVIDGFVSAVAAFCAYRLCPACKDYMFSSQYCNSKGFELCLKELNLKPYLNFDMKNNEGAGCILCFEIMSAACAISNESDHL